MKHDPTHKPTGDAAKAATSTDLPDGFTITRTIQAGRSIYGPGKEGAYAKTKPSKADVERLVEAGVIALPPKKTSK